MSVTCGFYNSLNDDRKYDAVQVSSIFDGIIGDGVYETFGGALMVSASGTGMIINVADGRAWFNHSWTYNDSIMPMQVEAAELVLDRIDAVVLEVNSNVYTRNNTIKIIKGIPGSTPEKPTMVHTDEINQYPLAYITVQAETTEITTADIENAVGGEETPFVIGCLRTLDASSLIAQWQAEFMQIMSADQTEFLTWFDRMKGQLSEDAAGHLQNEIDNLNDIIESENELNVFTVQASAWETNADTASNGAFPKIATIVSDKYSNTSTPSWDMISNENENGIPNAAENESIMMIQKAYFSSNGIVLYAVDTPTVALKLRVKGVL